MLNKLIKSFFVLTMILIFSSCGSKVFEASGFGENAGNNTSGSDVIRDISDEPAGLNCEYGGKKIKVATDEGITYIYICYELEGQDLCSASLKVEEIESSLAVEECSENGGTKIVPCYLCLWDSEPVCNLEAAIYVCNSTLPRYTVTYYGNSETSGLAPTDGNKYLEEESVTILGPSSLLKDGYSFVAWNTEADGSGLDYPQGSELIMPAEDVSLYARWESSLCNISYFSINSHTATIIGTDISLELPLGTDRTNLVSYFTATGVSVTVDGVEQISGVSANDFTNTLFYLVEAEDGSICAYDVNVMAEDFNPSTVSYWNFDEKAGFVAYDSAGFNDADIINATWGTRGLDFNGTDSRVLVPDDLSLNPTEEISLSAWVKWNIDPSTGNQWASIINKNVDSQYRLQHNSSNTAFEFAIRTSSGGRWVTSTTVPEVGVWYHVVGTYDGSTLKIYVNGIHEASQSHSGAINTSTSNLSIGSRSIDDRHFNGSIEKVSIYDKALTEEEVLILYNNQ